MKPRVLILIDWFDPAYKAGGPVRSCVNVVDQLHNQLEWFVCTSAYDLGQKSPLAGVRVNQWTDYRHQAKAWYATREHLSIAFIRRIIAEVNPQFIYLNGIFSVYFSVIPVLLKRMGLINGTLVMATRGMLKSSALAHKSFKKKLFIGAFRRLGLYRMVRFQATDPQEVTDIQRLFPEASVDLLPNLPGKIVEQPKAIAKHAGALKMIFIGRIHPIKNLELLLKLMPRVHGTIMLTIVGMREDTGYWNRCQALIRDMEQSKQVHYIGDTPYAALLELLQEHHLFVLPSRGENFGHAVFEAFSVGRPALISDQTPWKNLQAYPAGWELPLDQEAPFVQALQQAVDWNQQQYDQYAQGALSLARTTIFQSAAAPQYLNLFS